ncbi:hypothetical protein HELRODRAFT_182350 [Helobdella robusta]|uniref:Charged multivesicular body protein 6 n=1 Tax=Helobdella robusta TaxID=6412 RepID=T1FI37_HELRO|nr:hypothetical protein HELRODRAFT_182350 [Helobdella robusta]ESN91006.1 hypothetical protein HELRODRAFT_182350 [Helobdella robusta]
MGNLFASKKHSKSNAFAERDRVILQLKSQRDLLGRKIKKYDNDADRLKLQAKQLVHEQKKDKALVALRKKKFLDNTIRNLERQLEEVENLEIDDILSKGLNDADEEEVEKEFDQLFNISTENLPEPEDHFLVNEEIADQPTKIKVPTKQRKIALEAS